MFVRFQSPVPGKRGVHTGVFGLTNGLGRSGQLSPDEHAAWRAGNDWYTAARVIERIPPYLETLRAHGVRCVRVETQDPGRVIYEDDVQIVVVPHDPTAPTSFHPPTW